MRKSGKTEKYLKVIQDMYKDSDTVVRCGVVTDRFKVRVGLSYGSSLSPFSFVMVMLTDKPL